MGVINVIARLVCRAKKVFTYPCPIPAEARDGFVGSGRAEFKLRELGVMLTVLQGIGVVAVFNCERVFELIEDGG